MIIQKNSGFCLEALLGLAHLAPGGREKTKQTKTWKPILKFFLVLAFAI